MIARLTLAARSLLVLHDQLGLRPLAVIERPLGICQTADATEWLLPPHESQESDSSAQLRIVSAASLRELVRLDLLAQRTPGERGMSISRDSNHDLENNDFPTRVWMAVGVGSVAGHFAALSQQRHRLVPLDELHVIGADRLTLQPIQSLAANPAINPPRTKPEVDRSAIWAPTAAALGPAAWRRFQDLSFAVIGAGRMGSTISQALVRNGGRVTLIDQDRIERHNLGEMELVNDGHLRLSKAEALASLLHAPGPTAADMVESVPQSVLTLSALTAIKQSHCLVSAVDNPTARLVSAFLAALYLRPLLDLGTGIHHGRDARRDESRATAESAIPPHRQMGGDVRLILPGGCLLCCGGIANVEDAIRELRGVLHGGVTTTQQPWFQQRAGSLRSLNGCAASFGLRLIEDWLSHRFDSSRWVHLEFRDDGQPTLETRDFDFVESTTCPLCRLAGQGDLGLRRLSTLLTELPVAA